MSRTVSAVLLGLLVHAYARGGGLTGASREDPPFTPEFSLAIMNEECASPHISRIQTSCDDIEPDQLKHLAVALANCHLAETNRPRIDCPESGSITDCDFSDETSHNVYTSFAVQVETLCIGHLTAYAQRRYAKTWSDLTTKLDETSTASAAVSSALAAVLESADSLVVDQMAARAAAAATKAEVASIVSTLASERARHTQSIEAAADAVAQLTAEAAAAKALYTEAAAAAAADSEAAAEVHTATRASLADIEDSLRSLHERTGDMRQTVAATAEVASTAANVYAQAASTAERIADASHTDAVDGWIARIHSVAALAAVVTTAVSSVKTAAVHAVPSAAAFTILRTLGLRSLATDWLSVAVVGATVSVFSSHAAARLAVVAEHHTIHTVQPTTTTSSTPWPWYTTTHHTHSPAHDATDMPDMHIPAGDDACDVVPHSFGDPAAGLEHSSSPLSSRRPDAPIHGIHSNPSASVVHAVTAQLLTAATGVAAAAGHMGAAAVAAAVSTVRAVAAIVCGPTCSLRHWLADDDGTAAQCVTCTRVAAAGTALRLARDSVLHAAMDVFAATAGTVGSVVGSAGRTAWWTATSMEGGGVGVAALVTARSWAPAVAAAAAACLAALAGFFVSVFSPCVRAVRRSASHVLRCCADVVTCALPSVVAGIICPGIRVGVPRSDVDGGFSGEYTAASPEHRSGVPLSHHGRRTSSTCGRTASTCVRRLSGIISPLPPTNTNTTTVDCPASASVVVESGPADAHARSPPRPRASPNPSSRSRARRTRTPLRMSRDDQSHRDCDDTEPQVDAPTEHNTASAVVPPPPSARGAGLHAPTSPVHVRGARSSPVRASPPRSGTVAAA